MSTSLEALKRSLRVTYSNIIRGYSYSTKLDCFVKHFNDEDVASLTEAEVKFRFDAKKKGLEEEEEKIQTLINQGMWSLAKEAEIVRLSKISTDKQKMAQETFGALKEGSEEEAKEAIKDLDSLVVEKKNLVGLTIDTFVSRQRSDYTIYNSFYKDRKCSKKVWDEDEWEEVEFEELYDYIGEYNTLFDFLDHDHIQMIATQPYFLNKFFIANGDPMTFFGKPAVLLTQYQSELMAQGRTFKSILENSEKGATPPESYYDDPPKLVKWYSAQMKTKGGASVKEAKAPSAGKDSLSASTIVGADMEELSAIAIKDGEKPIKLDSEISKKMKDKGQGELNLYDMLELHGEKVDLLGGREQYDTVVKKTDGKEAPLQRDKDGNIIHGAEAPPSKEGAWFTQTKEDRKRAEEEAEPKRISGLQKNDESGKDN